jgi:hypothetical protein
MILYVTLPAEIARIGDILSHHGILHTLTVNDAEGTTTVDVGHTDADRLPVLLADYTGLPRHDVILAKLGVLSDMTISYDDPSSNPA